MLSVFRLLTVVAVGAASGLLGCAFPLNSGPYPQAQRPMMGPTTGYAPMNQQGYNGPVAVVPGAVTTLNAAPTTTVASNPGGITYFNVRQGDSVTSVATLYGVSETDLRKVNNMKPGEQINPGQLVRIPDGSTAIR